MKKTIMQSTVKFNGIYGVEVGDYAIITEYGFVVQKPIPETSYLELDQTDGKVEVNEELLAEADRINNLGVLIDAGGNDEDSNPTWLLDELEGPAGADVPPSNVKVINANMSLDGKLGWEYFPGYYLLEGGLSYSPYSRPPIQEDKIEPAEGEFTVDYERYVDATRDAEKLGFIAEAERLGIEGYID